MPQRFAQATRRMINKLPYWWKVKKDPVASKGAYFLDVIGMELDEAEYILNYALNQLYLKSADTNQADICYHAALPEVINKESHISLVTQEGLYLEGAQTLRQFFAGFSVNPTFSPEILLQHPYYIDYEHKSLYVRYPYTVDDKYPEGQVGLIVYSDTGKVLLNESIRLYLYHVWNFFDEFGLLLDCPRIYGEKNGDYKERLLDVMRFPGGAHLEGMINSLARGLLLKYKTVWHDAGQDLVLKKPYIALHTIRVDNKKHEYNFDDSGRVVLLGNLEDAGIRKTVTYAAMIEMKTLWDRSDKDFTTELFTPRGEATQRLRNYINFIKDHVPLEWGRFKWNQGVWDPLSISGKTCIPSFCDGSVQGWEEFGGGTG